MQPLLKGLEHEYKINGNKENAPTFYHFFPQKMYVKRLQQTNSYLFYTSDFFTGGLCHTEQHVEYRNHH